MACINPISQKQLYYRCSGKLRNISFFQITANLGNTTQLPVSSLMKAHQLLSDISFTNDETLEILQNPGP